jgi:hypothetical protein
MGRREECMMVTATSKMMIVLLVTTLVALAMMVLSAMLVFAAPRTPITRARIAVARRIPTSGTPQTRPTRTRQENSRTTGSGITPILNKSSFVVSPARFVL